MNPLSGSARVLVVVFTFTPFLFPARVFAQNVAQESERISYAETSISVGAEAQLAPTNVSGTTTKPFIQSLSPSAGVFATARESFKPWLGFSANFSYSRPTDRYIETAPVLTTGQIAETFVPSHMYEISFSYIAQRHLTKRSTVFGEAGGGVLGFSARNGSGDFQRYSNIFLREGIAGFGFDYRLTHGLGLRAQYRGLFTKYPYPNYANSPKLNTVISEPTLSLTYTFGTRSKR